MADKLAIMSFWDPVLQEVVDLRVTWSKGHDTDARIQVPARYKKLWGEAIKQIRWDHSDGMSEEPVSPYPTMPWEVPLKKLTSSATGFFAIMQCALNGLPGSNIDWKVPPPYPKQEYPERFPDGEGVLI